MSIFTDLPFPFHDPRGQELLRVLIALYRNEREAIALVERHGIDPADVVHSGSTVSQLWHDLLQESNVRGTTRAIVQTARDQFPNNPRAAFLDALLADKPAPSVNAASAGGDGAAKFIAGNDSITQPEALLFHDDLTMPTGNVMALIHTLQVVMASAPSVCLLRVKNQFGEFSGTGFKIGTDLVLTNEHVLLPKKHKAMSVRVDFGFEEDGSGAATNVVSLVGDVQTIKADAADDWAVVRVAGMDAAWPVIDLAAATEPKPGDLAYILQHPAGQRKRLGYVRNMVTNVTERVIHYLTDTEQGSSGAPVFDAQGRCIALHHAGGEPTEVAGKPPVSKNEGIRISRVRAALAAQGLL
jgi:S1-C subfamily serine protease